MALSVRDPPKKTVPWHVAMVFVGTAGMVATTAVHPLDLIKVRLQLLSRPCTTLEMASRIMRCRVVGALYAGLTAGLLRQTTYTTTRLGVYHGLCNVFHREYNKDPVLYEKLVISITAGLSGALAGNPSEVVLVRMMADGPLEACVACTCPRLYRGTFDALYKDCKEFFNRVSVRMFNLYQHIKAGGDKDQKEPETTGHDRFYQERSRSSYRKKKRAACRRAQSAAELNPESVAAANKRNAFRIRSVSTDKEESEEENSEKTPLVSQKIDSLAKLLFNKSLMGTGSGKSSPSEPAASPRQGDRSMENSVALAICNEYLAHTPRYHMLSSLNQIGARGNKKWFAIHDNSIKADRLLILMPLTSQCPIEPNETSRELIMELFRALHHPYIYPVLDVELCSGHALAVLPYSSKGSLKDLIYKSTWNEDYSRKYGTTGVGLPPTQVARFGRQMLEGLLFLKEKGFPPFRHLHSGNVMVQNGVARICGLENTLVGASPRAGARSAPAERVETLLLGHVLFEMCAGADTDLTLLRGLSTNYPQVVEIIELIFSARPPTLHELVLSELFRKIDLREMKGSCLPNFSQRLSGSCLALLNEVGRRQPGARVDGTPPTPPRHVPSAPSTPPSRRRYVLEQDYTEEWTHQW